MVDRLSLDPRPTGKRDIAADGLPDATGVTRKPCDSATVGQLRYNAAGEYWEICTYP